MMKLAYLAIVITFLILSSCEDPVTSNSTTNSNNDSTQAVDSVDINDSSITIECFNYIFHKDEQKLARINLENGSFTYVGQNIEYGSNTRGAVFNSETNQYIGFENDYTNGPYLVKINIDDGSVSRVNIQSSFLSNGMNFSDIAVSNDGDIYIFHDDVQKLAQIDITNGSLTYIGQDIEYGSNTRGAVFNSETNQYIGFENDYTNGPYLVKINIDDGSVSRVNIQSSFLSNGMNFSDIAVSNDGDVYIFHDDVQKLAQIDIANGSLTYIGQGIEYGSNTRGAVFNSETNQYIGFENDYTNGPYLVKINVDDGSVSRINIRSSFLNNGMNFSDIVTHTLIHH